MVRVKTRLGREDWVRAGLRALAAGGVDHVGVEGLARELGATKGSFYWHFADREALLFALHAAWEREATDDIMVATEAHGGTPAERIAFLVSLATTGRGDRLEGAMRAWAARSRKVRTVLVRVDTRRQAYVTGLLRETGLSAKVAAQRSHILYLTMVGSFSWNAQGGEPAPAATWRELTRLLLRPE